MKLSRTQNLKQPLRKRLRHILQRMSPQGRRNKSRKILKKILSSAEFKKALNLFVYASLPEEVETHALIKRSLRMKKTVYLPSVDLAGKRIRIYRIKDWRKDLRPGVFGVPEPRKWKSRLGKPAELDCLIVPGLGFDKNGKRLGRGGGFFDRFLKKTKKAVKIGIAFRQQLCRRIPESRHDMRVDRVITD